MGLTDVGLLIVGGPWLDLRHEYLFGCDSRGDLVRNLLVQLDFLIKWRSVSRLYQVHRTTAVQLYAVLVVLEYLGEGTDINEISTAGTSDVCVHTHTRTTITLPRVLLTRRVRFLAISDNF